MKKVLLAACLLLSSFPVHSQEWDTTEKTMLAVAETLLAIDMLQTVTIAHEARQNKRYELNPILGHFPSDGRVYGYFVVSGLLTYAIAECLEPEWRKHYLSGVIGFELGVTQRNTNLNVVIKI